jgi:flagellar biosynthetic protein FlhB
MIMLEERTQPPSKRRRQLARQQGFVAHSPELTAAGGWVAAILAIGVCSESLTLGFHQLVGGSIDAAAILSADPADVIARMRGAFLLLLWPLGLTLVAFSAGAFVAHQFQVRGLWAPGLAAPDPSRLWALRSGSQTGAGLGSRVSRSLWSMIKAALIITAMVWAIGSGWSDFLRLGGMEAPVLAQAAGHIVLHVAQVLAVVLIVLGLVDYTLRWRRFEQMLRTTPAQQREDRRVMEGDPAARAQRRSLAKSWRSDSAEILAGASLVLAGSRGLTLVLTGGPPPGRVTVRMVARGISGMRLRRSAQVNQVSMLDAPNLARRLASRPTTGSPVATELLTELAAIWPAL